MDVSDFEGSIVLEKLAEVGQVDAFYEAVDADDLSKARRLMKAAGIDHNTIDLVLKLIRSSDGNH